MRKLILALALLALPLAALAQAVPDGNYYLVGDHGVRILGSVHRGEFFTCAGNEFKISDYEGMADALEDAGDDRCPRRDYSGGGGGGASIDSGLSSDPSPHQAGEYKWIVGHFRRKQPAGGGGGGTV